MIPRLASALRVASDVLAAAADRLDGPPVQRRAIQPAWRDRVLWQVQYRDGDGVSTVALVRLGRGLCLVVDDSGVALNRSETQQLRHALTTWLVESAERVTH